MNLWGTSNEMFPYLETQLPKGNVHLANKFTVVSDKFNE